jgi:serine protease DegQ
VVVTLVLVALVLAGVAVGAGACSIEIGKTTTTTVPSSVTTAPPGTTGGPGATSPGASTTGPGASTTTLPPLEGAVSPAQAVAQRLGPSVVNIAVSGQYATPFGQQPYSAEGSGVIYSPDGLIITNNHVVTDQFGDPVENIEVTLATGEKLQATIVGRDPLTDLAVIRVRPGGKLPVATFFDGMPEVGEYAIAIGSPLGFENSVTLGIVSGLARSIEGVPGAEGVALTNLIQTDAPISPGNSGGALANARGQVIGINVAYLPPAQTGAVNIGFAIPSVVATKVAEQIVTTGKATHAYLGIGTQTVTSDLQRQFGLSRSSGVLVAEVTPNGPAAKAGMRQGDIIVRIDGRAIVESADVIIAIRDRSPGEVVEVTVDREGQTVTLRVTLEERPSGL